MIGGGPSTSTEGMGSGGLAIGIRNYEAHRSKLKAANVYRGDRGSDRFNGSKQFLLESARWRQRT